MIGASGCLMFLIFQLSGRYCRTHPLDFRFEVQETQRGMCLCSVLYNLKLLPAARLSLRRSKPDILSHIVHSS